MQGSVIYWLLWGRVGERPLRSTGLKLITEARGKKVRRLHRAVLWPLCLSILLSAVPVHASEAGRGSAAVEVAVTEGEPTVDDGGSGACA